MAKNIVYLVSTEPSPCARASNHLPLFWTKWNLED
jgi:hypothetical protein